MEPTLRQLSNRRRWTTARRMATGFAPSAVVLCYAVIVAGLGLVLVSSLDFLLRTCPAKLTRIEPKKKTRVYGNECYMPKGELRLPAQDIGLAVSCDGLVVVDPDNPGEAAPAHIGALATVGVVFSSAFLITLLLAGWCRTVDTIHWYCLGEDDPPGFIAMSSDCRKEAIRAEVTADAEYRSALEAHASAPR